MTETAISRAEINPFWHIRGANEQMDNLIDNFIGNDLKAINMDKKEINANKKVRRSKKNKKNIVYAGDGILNKIDNLLDVIIKDFPKIIPEEDQKNNDILSVAHDLFGNDDSVNKYDVKDIPDNKLEKYITSPTKWVNPSGAECLAKIIKNLKDAEIAIHNAIAYAYGGNIFQHLDGTPNTVIEENLDEFIKKFNKIQSRKINDTDEIDIA